MSCQTITKLTICKIRSVIVPYERINCRHFLMPVCTMPHGWAKHVMNGVPSLTLLTQPATWNFVTQPGTLSTLTSIFDHHPEWPGFHLSSIYYRPWSREIMRLVPYVCLCVCVCGNVLWELHCALPHWYSLGHLSSEVMGTISRSKLKALSGYGATN